VFFYAFQLLSPLRSPHEVVSVLFPVVFSRFIPPRLTTEPRFVSPVFLTPVFLLVMRCPILSCVAPFPGCFLLRRPRAATDSPAISLSNVSSSRTCYPVNSDPHGCSRSFPLLPEGLSRVSPTPPISRNVCCSDSPTPIVVFSLPYEWPSTQSALDRSRRRVAILTLPDPTPPTTVLFSCLLAR